jgi:hypothetical protein
MSPASSSVEAGGAQRLRRVAGIVVLLAVQGGCAHTVITLLRLQAVSHPPREVRRATVDVAAATRGALGFPTALGYVDHFEDDGFALMTIEGIEPVRIDAHTLLVTREGPARPSDLHPGAGVVVAGDRDAAGRILADVLVVGPAP